MAFHQSWSKIYLYIYVAYTFVYDGVKCSSEEKIKGIQLPIKLRTSLIKAGAFIFPAWFEQAISCSLSWMTFFIYLHWPAEDEVERDREWPWLLAPDVTPHQVNWSSKVQGGSCPSAKQRKKVLVPGFFLFFQLESDDGLVPDKRLIHWPDLWPAEQFQYPSLHW